MVFISNINKNIRIRNLNFVKNINLKTKSKMARLKLFLKKMRTYAVKKEKAVKDNFYRYLLGLDSN